MKKVQMALIAVGLIVLDGYLVYAQQPRGTPIVQIPPGISYLLRNNDYGSDLINIAIVMILAYAIRPLVSGLPFFAVDRNRLRLILPVLIGIPLGFFVEYTRFPGFPSVAIRRAMAAGCGAATLLWLARVFFHSAASTYRMDPVNQSGSASGR